MLRIDPDEPIEAILNTDPREAMLRVEFFEAHDHRGGIWRRVSAANIHGCSLSVGVQNSA